MTMMSVEQPGRFPVAEQTRESQLFDWYSSIDSLLNLNT